MYDLTLPSLLPSSLPLKKKKREKRKNKTKENEEDVTFCTAKTILLFKCQLDSILNQEVFNVIV